MDKKYIELFKELAHATEISAEQVMEYNKSKKDEKGVETAEILRKDFTELYDKIRADDFDGTLTKSEFAKLLVGCYVVVGNLQDRITALKKALAGYQTDLVPKLDEIIKTENDEEAMKLANEKFVIKVEE